MVQSQDKDWCEKSTFFNKRSGWRSTHCRTSIWNKCICPDSNVQRLVHRWNSTQFAFYGFFRYKIIWVKADMIFLTWFISVSFLFLFCRFSESQASICLQIHEINLKSMTAKKTKSTSSWRCLIEWSQDLLAVRNETNSFYNLFTTKLSVSGANVIKFSFDKWS